MYTVVYASALTHSFTHSLSHSLTRLLTHSLTLAHSHIDYTIYRYTTQVLQASVSASSIRLYRFQVWQCPPMHLNFVNNRIIRASSRGIIITTTHDCAMPSDPSIGDISSSPGIKLNELNDFSEATLYSLVTCKKWYLVIISVFLSMDT